MKKEAARAAEAAEAEEVEEVEGELAASSSFHGAVANLATVEFVALGALAVVGVRLEALA